MAGEPAIRKVLMALHDLLDGNLGAGVGVVIDRPYDQPFRDSELPLVNLRCEQVTRSQSQYNAWVHEARIMADIITPSATSMTVDGKQAEIEAKIAEVLLNPPGSITPGSVFDMLADILPLGIGQGRDDFDRSDSGETTSAWRCLFITPLNDFRTICGRVSTIA